jgi:hypothetical protein
MGFDVKEDEEVYPAPPPPSGFTSNCRGGLVVGMRCMVVSVYPDMVDIP